MTREEAMRKMQAVKSYMTSGNPIWDVAEMAEAFDMAIEALQDAGYMKWLEDNLLEYEPVCITCDIFGGSEECEKVCKFTCPQRECLYRAYQEEAMVTTKSNNQNQSDSELKTTTGAVSKADVIYRADAIDAIADYIHNVDRVYSTGLLSTTDCMDAARSVLDDLPSAQPETCEGCKHLGKWENEVEYGYPSPCTRCKRRVEDNYER